MHQNWILIAITGVAMFVTSQAFAQNPDARDIVTNRAPLEATPFIALPMGSVHAQGWLLDQLKMQRAGLTGSAEQLYDALTPDSGWLGGKGEGWEKGPYYVKGLIALAYTLDDAELKQRSQKWVDWALKSQRKDGFFGPASNDDWWPRMVVLFYLRDYYEATGDARVIPFLTKYFHHQLTALPGRPLKDWGQARAGDNIDVVLWTYNRTGDAKLIELAKLLHQQALPWSDIFSKNQFYGRFEEFHPHHIVNVTQALKTPAVEWQFTHDPSDRDALAKGIANLNKQYGRIDGQFSGTEMLSGLKSTDGVELCADIEHIISNGIAINILGDATLADQMEKVAFNSLPAHTTPTCRQITYYQLLNQIAATHGGHGFTQDYPNGNMPGPHSGFPCCCYNWHAGWPKFVQQMWAATADHGLAAIAYGPNSVSSVVGDRVPITITQTTEYPFTETISLRVEPRNAVTFPLLLRVPGWCELPTIKVNGASIDGLKPGSFARIQREWKTGDRVELSFPMRVRTSRWINQSIGIERGPLVFALRINEQWKSVKKFGEGFDEFEVMPQSNWNYALQIDPKDPQVKVSSAAVSSVPFDIGRPPVVLSIPAKRLPSWTTRMMPGTVVLGQSDGAWQQLADAAVTLEPKKPHHLRVEVKGKQIRVFVDAIQQSLIEQENDRFTAGSIGLRAYDATATFDDVKVNGQLIADFNSEKLDAWQAFGGHWGVKNGALSVEPSRDAKLILKDRSDLRDFVMEATISVSGDGNAGVIFHANNVDEKLDGYHGYYVGLTARDAKSADAQEPPMSPVKSDQPMETVELIPFGSAKLRVTYFPLLTN